METKFLGLEAGGCSSSCDLGGNHTRTWPCVLSVVEVPRRTPVHYLRWLARKYGHR